MPGVAYDLRYLKAGVDQLPEYLLSKELYWPLGIRPPAGEPPYPQFTMGALLLFRQRARGRTSASGMHGELNILESQIEAQRTRWRVAWGKKAAADFRARLNLWCNFLEEYFDRPEANADRYAYEVTRRAQLELLSKEAEGLEAAQWELLSSLDLRLKAVLVRGEFVWSVELQAGFPDDRFWFLYGYLPGEINPNRTEKF